MIFIKRYGILVNKQFKVNKKRHFSTILGIIMSMILFTMVGYISSYTNEVNLLSLKYETGDYEGVFIDLTKEQIYEVSNNILVKDLARFKVSDNEYITSNLINYKDYGKIELIQADNTFLNNIFKSVINLESGRLPENNTEVILDSYGKFIYEKKVGEYIEIDGKSYEIVGIFKGNDVFTTKAIDAITLLDDYDSKCNIAFNTLDNIKGNDKYETIRSIEGKIFANDGDYSREKNTILNKRLFYTLGVDIYEYSDYNNFNFVELGLYSAVLMVSVFLIYSSINVALKERVQQFAILRCIGATPSKIKLLLIKESSFLVIFSIIPGTIISQGVCYLITNYFFKSYLTVNNIAIGYKFYPKVFLVVILLTIISICISSIIPILSMSKISPLEAVRTGAVIQSGIIKRKSKVFKKIFGYNGELAYKNIRANNRNFIITTITSSILLIIFVVFSVYNMNLINSYDIEDELNKDISISINTEGYEGSSDILEKANNHIKDIEELLITKDIFTRLEYHNKGLFEDIELNKFIKSSEDSYGETSIKVEDINYVYSNRISILIMDDNYLLDLIERQFGKNSGITLEDIDENGVFISDRLVVKNYLDVDKVPLYNLEPKENFRLYLDKNNETDKKLTMDNEKVNKLIKENNALDLEYLGSVDIKNIINTPRYAYGDSTVIIASERFYEKNKELLKSDNSSNSIEITLDYNDNINKEIAREKAKNYSSKVGGYYLELVESNKRIRAEINIMSILIYTVLVLTMLIGGINIINNKYINIRLRGKEIGTLLAVGINRKRLTKILLLEGLMQWLITVTIGIGLSSIILKILLEYLYYANTTVNYSTIIIPSIMGALIILIINILGVYLPIRKLQYTKTTELIRSNE